VACPKQFFWTSFLKITMIFCPVRQRCSGIISLGITECCTHNVIALFVSVQWNLNASKYLEEDQIGQTVTYKREKSRAF
jgi:hypothetical protein